MEMINQVDVHLDKINQLNVHLDKMLVPLILK